MFQAAPIHFPHYFSGTLNMTEDATSGSTRLIRSETSAIGPKGSALFDDVVVVHVPHLALVDFEDFAKVLAMRQEIDHSVERRNLKHPLGGKWKCPRCGQTSLKIDGRRGWMRCPGTTSAWQVGGENECDAPPIDLAVAERLMFEALESFAEGREGTFAVVARKRYDEILNSARTERLHLKESAEFYKAEIKKVAVELSRNQPNDYLRASLTELADEHARRLEEVVIRLQEMPLEPDLPDPETSLLELRNMIAAIKERTPFGYGVNKEGLQFRKHLSKMIDEVTMIEKGDDVYDVEFRINMSAAMGMEGHTIELVRFAEQNMKAGGFKQRRKKAGFAAKWKAGECSISDRAWKKRPDLPEGTKRFGRHLRWVVDTLITAAETRLGTASAAKVCGSVLPDFQLQMYRASAECVMLGRWLQEVRPREHNYKYFRPGRCSAQTLRKRLERVDHPLLHLKRCQLSDTAAPLTDAECEMLWKQLDEVADRYRPSMRARIDQTIDMLRANRYATWMGPQSYRIWFNYQIRRGTLLKIMNFLRGLEGMPPLDKLPPIPGGRA